MVLHDFHFKRLGGVIIMLLCISRSRKEINKTTKTTATTCKWLKTWFSNCKHWLFMQTFFASKMALELSDDCIKNVTHMIDGYLSIKC